jgi:sugar/nucleoside kinase (ribokinase family)
MGTSKEHKQVVLVIGACGLDRLLTVPAYPTADDKVRTTAYHEIGGGNAANTATAIALLSGASFLRDKNMNICTKLLSKVGSDYIGKNAIEELKEAGVDLSSPLFRIGDEGTTTGITTIIVSELEQTRTCLHTPGTCGELTLQDVDVDVDVDMMDEIFEHVVHLHSDARHTDVALLLAREARKRGISVSLDVEKDRNSVALDALLEVATMVFTNSNQIEAYLCRLVRDREPQYGWQYAKDPTIVAKGDISLRDTDMDVLAHAIRPSIFFSRWFGQKGKQVIITKGNMGALSVQCDSVEWLERDDDLSSNQIELSVDRGSDVVRVHHGFSDRSDTFTDEKTELLAEYQIHRAGVLQDIAVVDTTGAGDAFIGGYILAQLIPGNSKSNFKDPLQTSLEFGCWVGGRKLQGPGARSALPKAADVDILLGTDVSLVQNALKDILTPFGILSETDSLGESWETFDRS